MQVFQSQNDMVAGTRQVYSCTWRVPSSCILTGLCKGFRGVQGRGRAFFCIGYGARRFINAWDSPMLKFEDIKLGMRVQGQVLGLDTKTVATEFVYADMLRDFLT